VRLGSTNAAIDGKKAGPAVTALLRASPDAFNLKQAQAAAALLTGQHDFERFCTAKGMSGRARCERVRPPTNEHMAAPKPKTTTTRMITAIEVEFHAPGEFVFPALQATTDPPGKLEERPKSDSTTVSAGTVTIAVSGPGFLTHQVRRISTLLVQVGLGIYDLDHVRRLLVGDGPKPEKVRCSNLILYHLDLSLANADWLLR